MPEGGRAAVGSAVRERRAMRVTIKGLNRSDELAPHVADTPRGESGIGYPADLALLS